MLKVSLLFFVALCTISLVDGAADSSGTISPTSRRIGGFGRFGREFPGFFGLTRGYKMIHIQKQIGLLYFYKVTGNYIGYKHLRKHLYRTVALTNARIIALERTFGINWSDIPFFGTYRLSDVDNLPPFYTRGQLNLNRRELKKFAWKALHIYKLRLVADLFLGPYIVIFYSSSSASSNSDGECPSTLFLSSVPTTALMLPALWDLVQEEVT